MKFPIKTPGDLLFVIILALPVLVLLAENVSATTSLPGKCSFATESDDHDPMDLAG